VAWTELRPKHIALLFRTRTPIPHFERALAERGIPYVTAAGLGFFDRAEVLDCIMMLRALSQPLDDMALAAVLRSPFVGVSDGRLWRIRTPGENRSDPPPLYHELRRDGGLRVFRKRFERLRTRTPAGVLDRDKQLGVVQELTEIVASAAGDPSLRARTWVLLTESPEGGWGIAGHANTNADIAAAARAALAGQ